MKTALLILAALAVLVAAVVRLARAARSAARIAVAGRDDAWADEPDDFTEHAREACDLTTDTAIPGETR